MFFFWLSCRCKDSLFTLSTPLRTHELDTFSTKCLTVTVQQCNQSLEYVKTDTVVTEGLECNNCEDNNSSCCKTEKGVLSNPKHPGWFGKGFAKVKKPRKKRRLR